MAAKLPLLSGDAALVHCSGLMGKTTQADGVAGLGLWVGAGQKGSKLTLEESVSCSSRAGRGAWSSRDGDGVAGGRAAGGALRGPRHSRQISWSVGHP